MSAHKFTVGDSWFAEIEETNVPGKTEPSLTLNTRAKKSGRGGARPGSGPKPLEPKVRRSVGLSERQWGIFDGLGGNDWLRGELDARQTPEPPKP